MIQLVVNSDVYRLMIAHERSKMPLEPIGLDFLLRQGAITVRHDASPNAAPVWIDLSESAPAIDLTVDGPMPAPEAL